MKSSLILKTLFVALFLFQASITFAQFTYGLRAGGQLVTLHTSPPVATYTWRPSYHGGLFFTYKFNNQFSAVADVLYSDKGYEYQLGQVQYNVHVKYLSVPLMAQYHFTDKFSILAGLEVNYFLSSYRDLGGIRYRWTSSDNPFSFGLGAGLAYQISPRLNIMARYFEGLTNEGTSSLFERSNSRTIQLSLGYFYQRVEDGLFKSDHRSHFSIGFRQGISKYVIVTGDNADDETEASSGRNGYQAEIDFRFTRRNFYISTSAVYSQKGGHVPEGNGVEMEQDFLAIPVVIGFSPLKTKYLTFSLEAGLAYNYQLTSVNVPADDESSSTKSHIASAVYGFELSTDALSKVAPFISYRKEKDMSYFFENGYSSSNIYKHRGQVFSLGLRLKLGSVSRDKEQRAARSERLGGMDSIVRPFSFGVKAGLHLNDTRHEEPVLGMEDHSKPLLGGHMGLYFQIRLYKRLSLVPEIQYIRKGFRFDHEGSERKALGDYIEFPFILSYQITNRLTAEAGVVMGVLVSDKFDPAFSTYFHDDYDWNYKEGSEKGWVAGARYRLSNRFAVGGRYYRGFSDISFQNWSDVNEYSSSVQLFTTFRIK